MPRRQNLPEAPADDIALARSRREQEFSEAVELWGDPRMKLLALADKAEQEGDIATAVRATAEAAQYVAPKLRAMEVKAEVQSTQVVFNIDLGDDEEETVNAPD